MVRFTFPIVPKPFSDSITEIACTELNPVYRRLLKMFLEELQLIDQQVGQLDKEMATLLSQHQAAVERLAEVSGLSSRPEIDCERALVGKRQHHL